MENRNGLAMQATVTPATGTAEREAALTMATTLPDTGAKIMACDKGYDTQDFVADLRALGLTPHVTQNTSGRRSAIDGRTTRHAGYAASLRGRKRTEEIFGWLKTVALMRKQRHRGLSRVRWLFTPRGRALQSGATPQSRGRDVTPGQRVSDDRSFANVSRRRRSRERSSWPSVHSIAHVR
jgi:DDE family transposase